MSDHTGPELSVAFMAASVLLQYPDERFRDDLDTVTAALRAVGGPQAVPLLRFAADARAADERALCEEYVATFDRKRKCSLHLSFYSSGDTRRRGMALVGFLDAYRAGGAEFDAPELPDYLPAVLEFAATRDAELGSALLAAHRDGIELLREALHGMGSRWAGVIDAVCGILPAIDPETRERFLRLADAGPPTELVGVGDGPALLPFTVREPARGTR